MCIALAMLYRVLGPCGFAGLAIMLAMMPLSTKVGTLQARYQKRIMQARDRRVKFSTEVFSIDDVTRMV